MSVKQAIPWQGKIAAKVVLSRFPARYHLWKRLGLFEHGCMEHPAYAFKVLTGHLKKAAVTPRPDDFVALEIGPGDSLFSGLAARALGASLTYLVDVGRFAAMQMEDFRAMERYLADQGLRIPDSSAVQSVDDLLDKYGVRYLTDGVDSLKSIPEASVDFVWSHATLEHVRRRQFPELARQIRRVLRPDGVGSHQVDLQDHLGGALNNLRFSERVWESEFMARSGFYTNRIGYSEMLDILRSAGLTVEVTQVDRWERLPTPQRKMATEFRGRSVDDLRVRSFHVLTRPSPSIDYAGHDRSRETANRFGS